jgi:hypothetical protein
MPQDTVIQLLPAKLMRLCGLRHVTGLSMSAGHGVGAKALGKSLAIEEQLNKQDNFGVGVFGTCLESVDLDYDLRSVQVRTARTSCASVSILERCDSPIVNRQNLRPP